MGRREDFNRHHTIRRHHENEKRRGISPLLMIMLILSMMMVITTFAKNEKEAVSGAPDRNAPEWKQLVSISTAMSQGAWGPELLDNCYLLMESYAESGSTSASKYMLMLAAGAPLDTEGERLITEIAEDAAQAETFRLAIEASNRNKLKLDETASKRSL